MSRNKKGRKHRTVNRTPRPRSTPATESLATPAHSRALEKATAAAQFMPFMEPDGPIFARRSRDGGLGHHAARTWRQLQAAGADGMTIEDLCAAVGYQSPTIRKHVEGLVRYELAKAIGDDAWAATDVSQWDAASKHLGTDGGQYAQYLEELDAISAERLGPRI